MFFTAASCRAASRCRASLIAVSSRSLRSATEDRSVSSIPVIWGGMQSLVRHASQVWPRPSSGAGGRDGPGPLSVAGLEVSPACLFGNAGRLRLFLYFASLRLLRRTRLA